MKMEQKVNFAWALVWAELFVVALYGSLLLIKWVA